MKTLLSSAPEIVSHVKSLDTFPFLANSDNQIVLSQAESSDSSRTLTNRQEVLAMSSEVLKTAVVDESIRDESFTDDDEEDNNEDVQLQAPETSDENVEVGKSLLTSSADRSVSYEVMSPGVVDRDQGIKMNSQSAAARNEMLKK